MKKEEEEMALVQVGEMYNIVDNIVKAVRTKAESFGLTDGAIGICCVNDRSYTKKKHVACFESWRDEDILHVFALKKGGSYIVKDAADKEAAQCFGVIAAKIAATAKAYEATGGKALTSDSCRDEDNIPGRQNWGGCVLFPLEINGKLCGKIYVAVSGGREYEDVLCAWEAYGPIRNGLVACDTTNPGPVDYEKND